GDREITRHFGVRDILLVRPPDCVRYRVPCREALPALSSSFFAGLRSDPCRASAPPNNVFGIQSIVPADVQTTGVAPCWERCPSARSHRPAPVSGCRAAKCDPPERAGHLAPMTIHRHAWREAWT